MRSRFLPEFLDGFLPSEGGRLIFSIAGGPSLSLGAIVSLKGPMSSTLPLGAAIPVTVNPKR